MNMMINDVNTKDRKSSNCNSKIVTVTSNNYDVDYYDYF